MLRKNLSSLPDTLDEMYDRILSSVQQHHRTHVHKILQWLAFSARPLTLAEVAEAIAVDLDAGVLLDFDERIIKPHDILAICSGLVTTSSWVEPDTDVEGKGVPIH
jgi:hypothetical protein